MLLQNLGYVESDDERAAEGDGAQGGRPIRFPRWACTLILSTHDLCLALAAFLAGCHAAGQGWPLRRGAVFEGLFFLLLAWSPLFFFPGRRLYNRHLVAKLGFHLRAMGAAFFAAATTAGIALFMHHWPRYMTAEWIAPLVAGAALILYVIHRVAGYDGLVWLKIMGLACILVGTGGLIGGGSGPILVELAVPWAAGLAFAAPLLIAGRLALVQKLMFGVFRRRFRLQTIIVGTDDDARKITSRIVGGNAPLWVVGAVSVAAKKALDAAPVVKPYLGSLKEIEALVERCGIQEAVISDEAIDKAELIGLLDFFTERGISAWFFPKLMPVIQMKLVSDELCGIPMVRLEGGRQRVFPRLVKPVLDRALALVALLALLPLFLLIAAAIRLTSGGPVFYRARAVGKGGRFFTLYKFRTMLAGAGSDLHKQFVTRLIRGEIGRDANGGVLKIVNDPRVTRVGRLLRRSSLDELPQLFNVLRGEMSLVGPRPCLPYEYELYKDWHRKRTLVLPGITGLWQVTGRSEVSFEDMILLDLYYIYNGSPLLELNILVETLFVIFRKKGAY
ncbi:MAG: exopolysaccharide biosynthesis polyprenyl glycosylphosphotransferase [Desulfobacterales bacterium]